MMLFDYFGGIKMGSFADYWEDEILDHLFGKGVYSPPTIYVGLSTADPLDNASGLAEPSGGSYQRVTTAPADWNSASGGTLDNANAITFPQATGDWGTITHFALFDASSGGNMLAHGSVSPEKAINTGQTFEFLVGNADVILG